MHVLSLKAKVSLLLGYYGAETMQPWILSLLCPKVEKSSWSWMQHRSWQSFSMYRFLLQNNCLWKDCRQLFETYAVQRKNGKYRSTYFNTAYSKLIYFLLSIMHYKTNSELLFVINYFSILLTVPIWKMCIQWNPGRSLFSEH